ncbi:unnamed protein product, partial [Callosobruchus maculatus]
VVIDSTIFNIRVISEHAVFLRSTAPWLLKSHYIARGLLAESPPYRLQWLHTNHLKNESGDCEQNMTYTRRRRNSKSLPASPLTSPHGSPKLNRKVTNRYFTAAFTDSVGSTGGSWILSNLLARRGVSASVGHIGEETSEEMERSSSLASVDESSGMKTPVFKARPSELREMNFWSPTSM